VITIVHRAAVLIATTTAVAVALLVFAGEVGIRSIPFTFFVNAFLLVWAVIVQRTIRLSFRESCYRCQPFEQSGRLYRWMGVHIFKRLMASRLWRAFNPDFRWTGRQTGLAAWKQTTCDAETAHALVFVLVLLITGYVAGKGWLSTAGWLLLFNILINGYPVMLQRLNRARIEMVLQRHAERSTAGFPAHSCHPDRPAIQHSEIGPR
jgi:hypothetical protein